MFDNKNGLLKINFLINKVIKNDNDKVADLGCGKFGYFVFPLTKIIGKRGKIYAVDIIKDNLESINSIARAENLTQIETIWSNLEIYKGTKIPDNSLDVAFLVCLLHQSERYLDILKESVRMLKTGGRLLIIDWNKENFIFNKEKEIVSPDEIKEGIKKLPLDLQEEFMAGDYHYGLLLIKK
jgi:ubiquinone/menaquinone biosynthesis C-methylase UbiE